MIQNQLKNQTSNLRRASKVLNPEQFSELFYNEEDASTNS